MDLGKNILLILKATFELYSIVVYVLFVMNSLEISPKRLNVPSIDGRFISCASTRSWESLSDHRGDSLNCPGRLYQAGSQFHVGCLVLTYPGLLFFQCPASKTCFDTQRAGGFNCLWPAFFRVFLGSQRINVSVSGTTPTLGSHFYETSAFFYRSIMPWYIDLYILYMYIYIWYRRISI